eukprot:gene8753-701_t
MVKKLDLVLKVGDISGIKSLINKVFPNISEISEVKPLTDGVTNILYRITMVEESKRKFCNVRINGEGTEFIIDRDLELEIMIKTSQHMIGPAVYARFLNGNVYEYIEGYVLNSNDMSKFASKTAVAVAKLHAMDIEDIEKKPTLFKTLKKWIDEVSKIKNLQFEYSIDDLRKEQEYLEKIISSFPVTFCHNDLQSRNLIYQPDGGNLIEKIEILDLIRLIDFEYACYNYRGFDIANYFCEYQDLEIDQSKYPSLEHQRSFIQSYLQTEDEKEIKKLQYEVKECGLLSNLWWGVWSLYQHQNSKIEFDFLEYGKKRIDLYYKWKNETSKL